MKLGADDLIIIIREKGNATDRQNSYLGSRISEIIAKYGGKMLGTETCNYSYYTGPLEIGDYGLPKTAMQYEIDEKHKDKIVEECLAI